MFDVNSYLSKFYEEHVRLGPERRKVLSGNRDACLERLRQGLKKLAEEGVKKAGVFDRTLDQGSYAMHTLNQQRNDDYDLDEAVIFSKDALPDGAADARKRVQEALERMGGNFAKPPEARTNAVTVWYAEGHHIDLAIYRENKTWLGEKYLEHAGPDWAKRDPAEMNAWFDKQVADKEPSSFWQKKTVKDGQLRRVVRFVKAFAKSRASWSLPGGMILTTLTSEVFVSDLDRDDVSLYKTLIALRDRLKGNWTVTSPLDGSDLTAKPARSSQVRRFRKRLEEVLPRLAVLNSDKCTLPDALGAWNNVFRHEFWGDARDEAEAAIAAAAAASGTLQIEAGIANWKEGPVYRRYKENDPPLNKGLWIRFKIANPPDLAGSTVRWTVKNSGDEAEEAGQLTHYTDGRETQWESTAYRGTHAMVCEIWRDGKVSSRGVQKVKVGSR